MNTKSDFCTLIDQLNTKLIVFIENDFEPLTDFEAILSKLVYLNSKDLSKLFCELDLDRNEDFVQLFKHFKNHFVESTTINHSIKKLAGAGRIVTALEISVDENPFYSELVQMGKSLIKTLELKAEDNEDFLILCLNMV